MIAETARRSNRVRLPWSARNAPGYEPLVTHVFIEGDKYIDSDVVFGVKNELIAKIEKRTDPTMPDGKPAPSPWHLMTYEFLFKPGQGVAPKLGQLDAVMRWLFFSQRVTTNLSLR